MRRILVCAAAGALVAASCSSSSHHSAAHTQKSSTSGAVTTNTPGFGLTANAPSVVSAGPQAHMSTALIQGLEGEVRDYILTGTVDVLTTGRLGKGFSELFGPDAIAAVARPGNDRLTMTDVGYPRGSGPVKVRARLHLTGLGDTSGAIVMVSAAFSASTRRGPIAIDRSGELLFAPIGFGLWAIIGYDVTARRATGTAPASTTTAATPPAAPSTGGKP